MDSIKILTILKNLKAKIVLVSFMHLFWSHTFKIYLTTMEKLLSHVVDEMVKNRTTVEIKRTEVEKVLDDNYVLKDHKNRIWGLMKRIIEKAGRKPKYN